MGVVILMVVCMLALPGCVISQLGDTLFGHNDKGSSASKAHDEFVEESFQKVQDVDAGADQLDTSELDARLAQIADSHSGTFSIACADAKGRWHASYEGDRSQIAASVVKIAIMGAFLEAVEAGRFSLDDTYVVKGSDIVGGTGTIQNKGAGTALTYRQLIEHMINVSDNTATNIIIDAIGMDAVNDFAARVGLMGTKLNRRMMDLGSGVENYVSANDVTKLLQMIAVSEFVSPAMSEVALRALESQTDSAGIRQGLTGNAAFAHKTGNLTGVFNDGGIVEEEDPYVIVVLAQNSSDSAAQDCMNEVAQAVQEWAANNK